MVYGIVNGYSLLLDEREYIQNGMLHNSYEIEESQWVRDILKSGGIFLDIGASFGWYTTLALSLVGSSGKVFAIEPGPKAYKSLVNNLGHISNLTIKNIAAGKTGGYISLFEPVGEGLYTPSCFSQPGAGPHEQIFVKVDALDDDPDIVACGFIDLVKIDIEGSEPDALWGMRNLLKNNKVGRIICEYNEFWIRRNNYTYSRLIEDFANQGFLIEKVSTIQPLHVDLGEGVYETQKLQSLLFKHNSI